MTQSPSPNSQPPLNEKIADIVLKAIMTGGFSVGGFGALWSLFVNSDLPKAIASAVIGVGISYGAYLLMPVHKGNKKRLEKTGETIDSSIDQMLKYLTDKATGGTPEDRYLACQALACQAVKSDGVIQHDGIFTPLLEEVFVSLSIDSTATLAGFRCISPDELINNDLNIWNFLAKSKRISTFRQLAILAWGGSGKTTLLKHVAYRYGSRQAPRSAPKLIPFLLILRKHRDIITRTKPPTLSELITQHHIPSLPAAGDLQMPEGWAEKVLTQGKAIVMFDGFDEVPKDKRAGVAEWINQQMFHYCQSVFILTSRPKAYTQQHEITPDPAKRLELATRLWVKDFDAEQRRDFVERWYFCQERYANGGRNTPDVKQMAEQSAAELMEQIEARDELKALAKNPLLLNMIVTFHRRNPGAELPQRRVKLYEEICQLQLKNRPGARKLETLLTECESQAILQQLAWGMMKKTWERIKRPVLLQGLKQILEQQGEKISATEFLEEVVQISELLVQQEDEYEFAHLSFQEYLAAAHIAQHKQEKLLYPYLSDEKWKPTILLYVAQVTNPTTLIQETVNQKATDLAYACLQETTKQVDEKLAKELNALKQKVQNSRYARLNHYLEHGKWREADNETYRLMLMAVGKDTGQCFTKDELLSFPCDELLAIDRLWVKYSNGKFGFSVQKSIYLSEEVGGITDGQYHRAFLEFCKAVGWVSFFNTDISSSQGYFPRRYATATEQRGLTTTGSLGGLLLLSHPGL